MITATNPNIRGKISALLEELLAAAVTEICELFDHEFATLRTADCQKCKLSQELDGRPFSKSQCDSAFENVKRLLDKGKDKQADSPREVKRNAELDTHVPHCSRWDLTASIEDTNQGAALLSVKEETVDGPELETEEENTQELRSDEGPSNSSLDFHTSLPSQTCLEWTSRQTFIQSDGKSELFYDAGVKSETIQVDIPNQEENDGGCLYQQQSQPSLWSNSEMASGLHPALHPNIMRPIDSSADATDKSRTDRPEVSNTRFTHWTATPWQHGAFVHRSWSRRRRIPGGQVRAFTTSHPRVAPTDMATVVPGNEGSAALSFTTEQERRFTCTLCGKRLLSEQTLKSHQKTHTGYAPHQCNQCGKRFSRLENLKVHQNIHTGLKPYTCKHCLKKFNAPSNFNRHKRVCLRRGLNQFSP